MKISVTNSISLDGVTQSPATPDEDRRGGFEHGGWAPAYNDDIMMAAMGQGMAESSVTRGPGALLFGRRTYDDFFGFWPMQTDGNPFTEVLNNTQKYVASRSLTEPLPWENSTLITGDVVARITELKDQPTPDLLQGTLGVLGSGELVRSLAAADLIDEYVLLIHPLLLGSGRRLFAEEAPFRTLELTDSVTTSTGVIIATYVPARRAS